MANLAVAEWLSLADRDLEAAHILSGQPRQVGNACFHAQQAAEKAMKAVYAFRGLVPPKTHDLDVLRERLDSDRDRLSSIAIACAVLSMYAVDARYPGADVEEEEVGPALDFAAQVLATVRRLVGEEPNSPLSSP
jgi:HEPN domain-containing protein